VIVNSFKDFEGGKAKMLSKVRPMQSNRKIVRIMMEPVDLFFCFSSLFVLPVKIMEMKKNI